MNIIMSALSQGLCYALVAMGVYISYKVLDFPDLSVDGTFPLGAAVSVMLIKGGVHPLPALLAAAAAGGLAGALTGILHVKFKITNLLSGILVMTALLSVTLNLGRIDGRINVIISYSSREDLTLFTGAVSRFLTQALAPLLGGAARGAGTVAILLALVAAVKLLLDLFMATKAGFMLRATGQSAQLVMSMGKNPGAYKVCGLMLANAIVAFAGGVYSQQMGYYDNASGTGMVVIGLASVIIGWTLFSRTRLLKKTTGVIIGAVIYSACLSAAVNAGIPTSYLKLLMAVLFTAVLVASGVVERGKTAARGKI